MICVSAGSKSRLAKAAGAEVAAQSRQEKWHAAVARSTFLNQNAKKLTVLAHFWKFQCRKMARHKAPQREYFWKFGCRKFPRRCDAKHICKSKCAKHLSDGVLFGSSDVANFHAAVARSTFASQNDKNMRSSGHFLNADVEKLSKNGTPLWRQAHWQVKMLKHLRFAALLEVPLCEFTN